ncbi:MAG: hypothetical protein LBQ91_00020 [Oscillospiraceae bacterium]|jgi:hypothetical protein|nr:hypothetical protein [Oscillospiraceae bacterium]
MYEFILIYNICGRMSSGKFWTRVSVVADGTIFDFAALLAFFDPPSSRREHNSALQYRRKLRHNYSKELSHCKASRSNRQKTIIGLHPPPHVKFFSKTY